jgi:hypothetical protein
MSDRSWEAIASCGHSENRKLVVINVSSDFIAPHHSSRLAAGAKMPSVTPELLQ